MKKWNVQIGINPIGWANDDMPELGGATPLATILQEGSEIGYAGFELGRKFPRNPQELKEVLAKYKVACVSGWYSGRLARSKVADEIAACAAHMELLKFQGCRVAVYGEVADAVQGERNIPLSKRPQFSNEAQWRDYGERLNAFGRHLLSVYGLRLAYHHHTGAYVESPEDIDRLMASTDPAAVGLLFDSGHAWFGACLTGNGNRPSLREAPVELLRRHLARVVHVHCKDVRAEVIEKARNDGWSFMNSILNGTFTVPGDGNINFTEILTVLHQNGYEGWLVVEAEQDPAIAPSYAYAEKGLATLRAIVKKLENAP